MINSLSGTIKEIQDSTLTLDIAGVGFSVCVFQSSLFSPGQRQNYISICIGIKKMGLLCMDLILL